MGSGVTFRGKALIEGQYLEAADCGGKKIARQIVAIRTGVKLERKGKVDVRPAFKLAGEKKEWILNTTNLKSLAKLYGHQAEDFIGKWVVLYGVMVDSFGEEKLAIRIDVDATRKYNASKGGKSEPAPQEAEPQQDEPQEDEVDEQVLADAAREAEQQGDEPGANG